MLLCNIHAVDTLHFPPSHLTHHIFLTLFPSTYPLSSLPLTYVLLPLGEGLTPDQIRLGYLSFPISRYISCYLTEANFSVYSQITGKA